MKKSTYISAIIAGALALTSSLSAPASAGADSEQLTRYLLGAAAIAAIAHASKKHRQEAPAASYDAYNSHVSYKSSKPRSCLRKKYTNHGWKTFYSKHCLNKHRSRHRSHYSYGHGHKKYYGHKHSKHYRK